MKRGLRILALAAGVALALMAVPAQADNEPNYLALGDSVPFGFNPLVTDLSEPDNFVGYPEVLSQNLENDVTNASCPGETTMHFIALTGLDDTCGLYRAVAPLHTAYAGSQLQFALAFLRQHPDTRFVTIMVGADDVNVFAKLCNGDATCIGTDIRNISIPSLAQIFGAIRTVYKGQLITVTYYARNNSMTEIANVLQGNAIIAGIATSAGSQIANGFAAFQAVEGPAQDPCAAGLLIKLPNGTCDSHPSAFGQRVLASAVRALLPSEN